MTIKLIPLQTGSREMFRQKAEQTLQNCLDHVQNEGDADVWGPILRTVGTQWLEKSTDHDFLILR